MSDVGTLNELPDASPLEPHGVLRTRMGGAFVGQRAVFAATTCTLIWPAWIGWSCTYSVSRVCVCLPRNCACCMRYGCTRATRTRASGTTVWSPWRVRVAVLAPGNGCSVGGLRGRYLWPGYRHPCCHLPAGGMPFAGGWRGPGAVHPHRAEGASLARWLRASDCGGR